MARFKAPPLARPPVDGQMRGEYGDSVEGVTGPFASRRRHRVPGDNALGRRGGHALRKGNAAVIKFEKVTPGSVLLDVRRRKAGNTTAREWGCWLVKVVAVDKYGADVRWNSNPAKRWSRAKIERLHVNPPKGYREQCEKRGHVPLVGKLAPEVHP